MPNDNEFGEEGGRSGRVQNVGGSKEDQIKLARNMERLNIHPVLIFGVAETGKSMLLASLINFRRGANGAGATLLGENLDDSPFRGVLPIQLANERETRAQKLYNDYIAKMLAGIKVPNTNVDEPFFVQLSTRFGYAEEISQRISFMEGNGEWYRLKTHKFDPMKWEVEAILNYFNDPISVIFVAPKYYADRAKAVEADGGLEHCIQRYDERRSAELKAKDNLMFVISKWDSDCTREDFRSPSGQFNNPTSEDCIKRLKISDRAWGAFKSVEIRECARVMTPHAAAIFDDVSGEIDSDETDRHCNALDNFDRVVWDWLGENIFQQHDKSRTEYYPIAGDPKNFKVYSYDRLLWRIMDLKVPERKKKDVKAQSA
jgi:hypothetical protein